jgi:heme exporter protein B
LANPRHNWWSEARAVFVKDVRSELRTRSALTTILLFAVVTLMIVAFTIKPEGLGLTYVLKPDWRELVHQHREALVYDQLPYGTELRAFLLSALLWIILFFSAMAGLPRTFVKEEEMRTAAALRLAARPSALYAGKLAFNGVLVLAVAVVVLPLFLILLTPRVADWPAFLGYLFSGSLAMAGAATLLGAIVARAGGKAYLMLPLAFPILLPALVLSIQGCARAMLGNGGNQIIVLVSYLVAMVTLSGMLFEKVWSDA